MPSLETSTSLLKKFNRFDIRVDQCKFGRGVFACRDFKKGSLIEVCPMLIMPPYEAELSWVKGQVILDRYFFDAEGYHGLALGYGSLYNHAKKPNAEYIVNLDDRELVIHAVKKISEGEQIFIDYGYDPAPKKKKKTNAPKSRKA